MVDTVHFYSPLSPVEFHRNHLQTWIEESEEESKWASFNASWASLPPELKAAIAQHRDADNTTLFHQAVQFPDAIPIIEALFEAVPENNYAALAKQATQAGETPLQLLEQAANDAFEDDEATIRENYLEIANILITHGLITHGADPAQLSDGFQRELDDYNATD
jgi:hypothetical protein